MNPRLRREAALEMFRSVTAAEAVGARLWRHLLALAIVAAGVALWYGGVLLDGWHASATTAGRLRAAPLDAPVSIVRDGRDVPHVVAATLHDAYFAQGFAEGSDRLFQMELTRRYAFGRLAEVLGPKALAIDQSQRYYDVRAATARQWRRLDRSERDALVAFSDGVNEAMRDQPLPVEFRLLLYRPEPWTPQDSLAVSVAVSIALSDSWHDVLARDDVWRRSGAQRFEEYFPLSDPVYDVTTNGSFTPRRGEDVARLVRATRHAGSNAWAAGSSRTASHRPLLANDPHLDLTIPGLWYVLDLRAPGLHVAGASIPGAPGVLLGHNDRIAWGATNADVASTSVYEARDLHPAAWKYETFRVRFAHDATLAYYRAGDVFGVPIDDRDPKRIVLVRRPAFLANDSALRTFLALDRARDAGEALAILSRYGGTAENFAIADRSGRVAYHLAGNVPNDPAWGRYVHPAADLVRAPAAIPFARLPAQSPSREALVVSANNKMYGPGYPYRLAAAFDPPYRAYRIAELLGARTRYDAAYFEAMQLDTKSPVDLEFARTVAAYVRQNPEPELAAVASELAAWDGDFAPGSRAATVEHALRDGLQPNSPSLYALMRDLRSGATSDVTLDLRGALFYARRLEEPWGSAGSVPIEHPLAPLRFAFLNGATLPGAGDEYTIHLQEPGFSQSFRAVWDVGNWDAGGIAIPSGESGEPASGHYTDLSAAWVSGRLDPLPFSESAVRAAAVRALVLEPRR